MCFDFKTKDGYPNEILLVYSDIEKILSVYHITIIKSLINNFILLCILNMSAEFKEEKL